LAKQVLFKDSYFQSIPKT